jgi:hypothetical protein
VSTEPGAAQVTLEKNGKVSRAALPVAPNELTLQYQESSDPGRMVTFYQQDWLVRKAGAPITSGNMCQGFLLAFFRGIERWDMPGSVLKVSIFDALDNETSCEQIMQNQMQEPLGVLPLMDMKVGNNAKSQIG